MTTKTLVPSIHSPLFRSFACATAFLGQAATSSELTVNSSINDLVVAPGQTVWFDSANTNNPIPLNTINGSTPAVGFLPGWAHTQNSFLKYDGANVVEIPNGEKIVGPANLASAGPSDVYFDNMPVGPPPETLLSSSKSIGLLETTRDFTLANGVTLDIAQGGLMFHNNNHWLWAEAGNTAHITSSSGRLVVSAYGTGSNNRIHNVIVSDYDAGTPLTFVKTGPERFILSNNANTYTGGTRVHNGRLEGQYSTGGLGTSFGTGPITVVGSNAQVLLSNLSYANDFNLSGLGWTESGGQYGALRFGNGVSSVTGSVAITGEARIGAAVGATGTLAGSLTGSADLEFNSILHPNVGGTINLNGNASGYTGDAIVGRGRLNLNNAFGGNLTIWDGAELGGEGSIAGDLVIGGSPRSVLWVDASTPQALSVSGTVDFYDQTEVKLSAPPSGPGPVVLFTYGEPLTKDPASWLIPVGVNGSVQDDPANSRVIFNLDTSANLVWTGADSDNWFTGEGATNFIDSLSNPAPFFVGDHVTFDNSSIWRSVFLIGSLAPGSVTFDFDTGVYTLSGTGGAGIIGNTGLVKRGEGALTLGGEGNAFTGPVSIEGGILKLGAREGLGSSSGVTIASGAQLDLSGLKPGDAGRQYTVTIEGDGPDGLGAIINSANTAIHDAQSGIQHLVLSGDATVGGTASGTSTNARRVFGIGSGGTIDGNGHTLTKAGTNDVGFFGEATDVEFVIAGGRAWAESSDNAWGGAGGHLTIKSGARAGTFGDRTIPTPVTIESGGILFNIGGGTAFGWTGTWTGNFSVSGNVSIESVSNNAHIVITGPVTGAANLTKANGNTVTIAQPGWTGNTTVSAGTLSIGQPTLDENSTVTIGAAAVLNLNFSGSNAVAALVIGTTPQPNDIYNSSHPTHGARFTGAGSLIVGDVPPPSGYSLWAAQIPDAGLRGFEQDADGDGIPNGLEYVLGGNPNVSGTDILPTLDASGEDTVLFVFDRNDDSTAGTTLVVEYGDSLTAWPDVIQIPGPNAAVEPLGGGVSRITVTIPKLAPRLFARLKVTQP